MTLEDLIALDIGDSVILPGESDEREVLDIGRLYHWGRKVKFHFEGPCPWVIINDNGPEIRGARNRER
jgi:hypothetical protein